MNPRAIIAVTAAAVAVFFVGAGHPEHNWDMIGYVASAYHRDGLSGAALSAKTYQDVQSEVDPSTFRLLTDADGYRRAVYQNPAALDEQLPFYSTRMLYVAGIRALGATGISYSKATILVSALSSALAVAVLAFICLRVHVSAYLVPVLAPAAGYLELAGLSTPDALAVFCSLLATLACMWGSAWVFVLAAVLPAIRTDYIIYSGLLLLASYLRGEKLRAPLALGACAAIYLAVRSSQHAYGWLTLFHVTFVERVPFPSGIAPSPVLRYYLPACVHAASDLLRSPHLIVYLICAYLLATFRRTVLTRASHPIELLAVPASFAALHLALFPSYKERFFVLPASLMLIWAMSCIKSKAAP